MIKSPEIKVNPNMLKTLRESSGYTVEEIAKKIKTTVCKNVGGQTPKLTFKKRAAFVHKAENCKKKIEGEKKKKNF